MHSVLLEMLMLHNSTWHSRHSSRLLWALPFLCDNTFRPPCTTTAHHMVMNELELLRLKCYLYENSKELLAQGAITLLRKYDPIQSPERAEYYYVVINDATYGRISLYFTSQSDILHVAGVDCPYDLLIKVPFEKFYRSMIVALRPQQ